MGVSETRSAEETEALGAELAATLAPGDVVLLSGEVGSGKTTLVRGALRALGVQGRVTSPTFTLGRLYDDATPPVAHLDLHRLAGLDDEDPAFLDDHLTPERIAFVEWPQVAEAWVTPTVRVRLEHAGDDARRITVERA